MKNLKMKTRTVRNATFNRNKIKNSHIVIIGIGILGCKSVEMLGKYDIKKLTLIDRDFVESKNLGKQTLYSKKDVGLPKTVAAKRKFLSINPKIKVNAVVDDFNFKNAETLLVDADLVIDGTDNLETRFLINDLCVKNKIPWIYGSVIKSEGASFDIIPGNCCLRCIFRKMPKIEDLEICEVVGVADILPLMIAKRQVTEAIKILSGKPCSKKYLRIDLSNDIRESLVVTRNENCETCVKKNFIFLNGKFGTRITKICGKNTFQLNFTDKVANFDQISNKLKNVGKINFNKYLLHFKINGKQISLYKNGRCIISGVKNKLEAKSLFAKYIGS